MDQDTTTELKTRVLLLIEDNEADADLVQELLRSDDRYWRYQVHHVTRLADAEALLAERAVDVVLLDLRLPDSTGLNSVRAVISRAREVPVVVLTGAVDESMALSCIDAGAQDYLRKDELQSSDLRRSIGYAITRLREAQLRELQTALQNYRALASTGRTAQVTAQLAGVGPLRERKSDDYRQLVEEYRGLLDAYLHQLGYKADKPSDLMAHLSSGIGDLGGGPRDLIDVHIAALESAIQGMTVERTRFFVVEGRLLALEMMGLLVDYYRVGQRRRLTGGRA